MYGLPPQMTGLSIKKPQICGKLLLKQSRDLYQMTQQPAQDTDWSPNETVPIAFRSSPSVMISPDQSRSGDIGDLMLALAKAQGQIGDIPRNRTVTVQPKSGGQAYHFKYATLSAIIDAIKKPLSENGLAY